MFTVVLAVWLTWVVNKLDEPPMKAPPPPPRLGIPPGEVPTEVSKDPRGSQ